MKLVEILARELGEWPEGFEYMRRSGNTIYFCESNGGFTTGMKTSENEDGCHGAWVTREMWEAERERIKLDMYSGSITTKPKWRGSEDGLPPIGSQVMFKKNQCEVIGYHNGMVVCAMDDDYENGCYDGFLARDLRPIPTDREKWIEAAMNYWDHEMPRVSLEHIYDAGLAKLPD